MMYLILFWILLLALHVPAQVFNRDYPNDYILHIPDIEQEPIKQMTDLEIIRPKSGSELILKCKSHGCHKDNRTNTNEWEFVHCKTCNKKIDLKWTRIPKKKICLSQLHHKNVTSSQNGLYRCIVNNLTTVTYEVEIVDTDKYYGDPPKLLDLQISPNETTLKPHTNVLVQCKVNSKHQPSILWFKQCDLKDQTTHCDFEYSGNYYTRINTTHDVYMMKNEENVYISKLNLQNMRQTDSGIYVCLAVTMRGKDYRIFKILVMPTEQSSSLSVLFLIPVPFVLIPICVWLCYYKNKNMKIKKNEQVQHELMPINNIDVAGRNGKIV